MQLDCKEQEVTTLSTCGKSPEQACCDIQEILINIRKGGTLHVLQHPTSRQSACDKREEIQVDVTKSFTVKTLPPERIPGVNSTDNGHVHGIEIMFRGNCSERCRLTIDESQFSCSLIEFDSLDVQIKHSLFMDSSGLRAKTQLHGRGFDIKIKDSEFRKTWPVKIDTDTFKYNRPYINQYYVSLRGNWNSVEIVRSIFEGDRQSQVFGVEIMYASIKTLHLVDVEISFMLFALVIQSSGVGLFNVSDCIFLGNRDGIDIGQGVRYMIVSRSQMNNTGSAGYYTVEICSSALKGSVQNLEVEESIFAQNQALGKDCKGAALYLRTNVSDVSLLRSHSSVRAVTVYGAKILIQIVASIFLGNKASKGTALFIAMSNKGHFAE